MADWETRLCDLETQNQVCLSLYADWLPSFLFLQWKINARKFKPILNVYYHVDNAYMYLISLQCLPQVFMTAATPFEVSGLKTMQTTGTLSYRKCAWDVTIKPEVLEYLKICSNLHNKWGSISGSRHVSSRRGHQSSRFMS